MVNNISKTELIRRTAVKSGIPETDAKTFFEMFLGHLSGKLDPGDTAFIEQLGYFHFNKAVMRGPNPAGSKEQNVVLFSTAPSASPSVKDHLLLNVPASEETESFNSADQFFSLSIGKPVIPLKSAKYSEFVLPPSGPELRAQLFSKARLLFNEAEIKKADAANVSPLIIPFSRIKPADEKPEQDLSGLGAIEETILFQSVEPPAENETTSLTPKEQPTKEPASPDYPLKASAEELTNTEQKYERVKPAARPRSEDKPPVQSRTESRGEFTHEENRSQFTGTKEFLTEKPAPKTIPPNDRTRIQKRLNQNEEDEQVESSYKRRRNKARILVLAGLLVLSAAAALIYYSPLFQGNNIEEIVVSGPPVVPVIVERTYEIPVTYPYDKSIVLSGFTYDPISLVQVKNESEGAQNVTDEVKEKVTAVTKDGVPVKLKDNIYQYKDFIAVQVSSWKSITKAKEEVERYNKAGFKAFLEEGSLKSKTSFYRVRVGNFSTLNEAEDFLRKNF